MPESITFSFSQPENKELKVPCIKCEGKTAHKVIASFDEHGEQGDSRFTFEWHVENQIVQCLGCKLVSFRKASSNSEDYEQIGDEWDTRIVEELYPSRIVTFP